MTKKTIKAGKILKPHGLNGELKIETYTKDKKNFKNYGFFIINNINYTVEYFKDLNKYLIIKLKGINKIEDTNNLVGHYLYLTDEQISIDKNDEYLLEDLIGIECIDNNKVKIGKIINYLNIPGNELFEIDYNGNTYFVPYNKKFFKKFDGKNNMFILDIPEEFYK